MTQPDAPGLLRAIQAEASRDERRRLFDLLRIRVHQLNEQARQAGPRRPDRTTQGQEAARLAQATEWLESESGEMNPAHAGEPWASISGAVDSVELYEYTVDDDPMPVRVVVYDGGADATAVAYFTVAEAEALHRDLGTLIERLRTSSAGEGP